MLGLVGDIIGLFTRAQEHDAPCGNLKGLGFRV
jgi:hypothetical protein